MNFLTIQNQLKQTGKAQKGISNRQDYYGEDYNRLNFDKAVYRKALIVANKVVQHFYETGEIDPHEKISVAFGKTKDETKNLQKQIHNLQAENAKLKEELNEYRDKFRRGGRKGYDDTMIAKVKLAREQGETWRGLAARLNISTATAQKLHKLG